MSTCLNTGGSPVSNLQDDLFHCTYETLPSPPKQGFQLSCSIGNSSFFYDPHKEFTKERSRRTAQTLKELELKMGGAPFLTPGGILDHYYTLGFDDIVSKHGQRDRAFLEYGRGRSCTKAGCCRSLLKTLGISLGIAVICGIIYYYS